jgi:hypothetical protein
MKHGTFARINQISEALLSEDYTLTAHELDSFFDVMSKDSRDNYENAVFAYRFTIDMECMIHELQEIVLEHARKKPAFKKQLLPLYEVFFTSLHISRFDIFYQVCSTLLDAVKPNTSCSQNPSDDFSCKQLELAFFDDDF